MQGYGGLLPAEEAAERAVGMLECGPAAGVIGSRHLGKLMEDEDIIACDMGGTTFKVGVIQGGTIDYAREPMVDRYHYVGAEDRGGLHRRRRRQHPSRSTPRPACRA